MLDLFKKAVLMGLGAITLTKEKVEQIVDELIKKGELTEGERSKAIRDFLLKAQEQDRKAKARGQVRRPELLVHP